MSIRVLVVGHGMVGSRFVEELLDRDPEGHFTVTVLGAEEYEPYNRVLLSDLVAGKVGATSLALPPAPAAAREQVRAHRGAEVVALDRANRTVVSADGGVHPYDVLVLATGAAARVPSIGGLEAAAGARDLPGGVHVLRTLDDARAIVAATLNASSAAVVGGGVLGLEVASGLAGRGLPTSLVHATSTLMQRQLDHAASTVVAASLERIGVRSIVGSAPREVLTAEGRITGLRLGDGMVLPVDLLVLSTGTVPETGIARAAGLDIDLGVLVGPDLATAADPRIHAIGDCAQPPEGSSGLIAQGWDQARRLAAHLVTAWCGEASQLGPAHAATPPPQADPSTDVVRVKASGLDLVTMGLTTASPLAAEHRVLRLSDPVALRHIELVVDGERVLGAACVGAGKVAADLTVAYTRGTPLPADPAQLLLRAVSSTPEQATSPTKMPDRLTVCRCNGVTKRDIITCWTEGGRSVADVAARTRATTGCGGCGDVVSGIVDWLAAGDPNLAAVAASHAADAPREHTEPGAKQSAHSAETSRG
jgi:assimilatory nitrate reductase electron transfer subunit